MTEPKAAHVTLHHPPRASQRLKLTCRHCGHKDVYDVGTILFEKNASGEGEDYRYSFTNYFRCKHCGSAGPWDVSDLLGIWRKMLRSLVERKSERVFQGQSGLLDGTRIQTPAMGEDYLKEKIRQEPFNAFLRTRLGNLMRGCGQTAAARQAYEEALKLNPTDIEARFHLLKYALEAGDIPAALKHAPLLVWHLLEGETTGKDELDEGLACGVVEELRRGPKAFRDKFTGPAAAKDSREEEVFIRTLLEAAGDEETILADAAERLLAGEAAPVSVNDEALDETLEEELDTPVELVPSLREVVEKAGLNAQRLGVGLERGTQGHIRIDERHLVPVTDGQKAAFWEAPALRELFRGNRKPPSDREMNYYPAEYVARFFLVEKHVLTLCHLRGDRTDQEMEEIFATLRRRPDGRSVGEDHDFFWQVAALLLGQFVTSEAEFEAIFGQLERSVRHWALKPVSRFYVEYLHRTFEQGA